MTPRFPAAAAVVALGFALGMPALALPPAAADPPIAAVQLAPAIELPAIPAGYRAMLTDDFESGALDGKWTILSGTWRAENGMLRSSRPVLLRPVQPLYTPIASTAERPLGLSPAPNPNVAALSSNVSIPNAFRVALVLAGRGVPPATINIGPYLGDDAGSGYRLIYDGEYGSPLKLKFVRGSRAETVASADPTADLYDGNHHTVVWTRDRAGHMIVAIDGQTVVEASDLGIASGFDGFSIVNAGGSWSIDALSVDQPEG
jgi:hypothetical protein